jgi:tetratricopeptide (TPR) repeat protein
MPIWRSVVVVVLCAFFAACSYDEMTGAADNTRDLDLGTKAIKQAAANLSFGDAIDLVQRKARWAALNPAAQLVVEYTPKQFVTYRYSRDGSKGNGLVCPYETFEPYYLADSVFARGPHKGTGFIKVSSGPANMDDCVGGNVPLILAATDEPDAIKVAQVFWRLKATTLAGRQAWAAQTAADFARTVATYRAANPKPKISESVYRLSVIAAAAMRDQRIPDAIDAYDDALKIAPWWPQGQANIALALGEFRYYDDAIDHMKDYLALVPDAPDARQAQNKIYEWQGAKAAF